MATGFTKEEEFINNLGERSFLKFWAWPNLFRDQGKTNNGDGKEICDLTVIFGNDILLFSDKKIKFNEDKKLDIGWSRWARRAIGDSIKQIKGATRWYTKSPDRVYVDKACQKKLPVKIPSSDEVKFHNIVVCHGIEQHIETHNSEASFFIDNSLKGEQNWNIEHAKPFTIGEINEDGFVHVFNEATVKLVLEEFDTAHDFINYLKLRERVISYTDNVFIKSESDLIQLFYENYDNDRNTYWLDIEKLKKNSGLKIDKGGIEKLYSNPYFLEKKRHDKVSYFWDGLIDSFSFHILNGTSERNNWESPSDIEPCLRQMAETTRFERRFLADGFLNFYYKALPGQRGTRILLDPRDPELAYLFLVVPNTVGSLSKTQYREMRLQMLTDYCQFSKLNHPSLKAVIGVACETRNDDRPLTDTFFQQGQDYVFCDFSEWDEEQEIEAKFVQKEYIANGLLSKRKMFHGKVNEFPEDINNPRKSMKVSEMKGTDRNKPCPCGSQRKFKKCCGNI